MSMMKSPLALLQSRTMPLAAFSAQPEQWKAKVLGAISFLPNTQLNAEMGEIPCLLAQGASDAPCEIWLGHADASAGRSGAIRYRHNDAMLFGVLTLPESGHHDTASPLQQATESAYRQLFALLDTLNYPHLYRVWNYMADINGISHGLERYRQFNLGRQQATLACGQEVAGEIPAACALGMAEGPLTIAFLAGRTPSLAIENPRQISAYDYPQQYGPRSPTFSRASLLRLPRSELLFVSGTASIVGHQTMHPGDVVAQTREMIANLQSLINEANLRASPAEFTLAHNFYRVYIRNAADIPIVKEEMARLMGPALKVMFVRADICREDLLVEIETTAELACDSRPARS